MDLIGSLDELAETSFIEMQPTVLDINIIDRTKSNRKITTENNISLVNSEACLIDIPLDEVICNAGDSTENIISSENPRAFILDISLDDSISDKKNPEKEMDLQTNEISKYKKIYKKVYIEEESCISEYKFPITCICLITITAIIITVILVAKNEY
ncbi:hypothetical protein CWI36_2077p0020 [Hamiltosporidium magnivora]|uniref:Uncharacterized protein n=1 Tax=Hamiltosporidium magnivora TaxID=148818 RepID=A0A4Q9KWY2_9MICR|nr:hypothetical protein CWI36_2077p0020 [Hamiltosporidium magnivora]